MTDERFRLLVGGAVGCVAMGAVTVLLIFKIDVASIIAGLSAIGTMVSLFVLSEIQKVKANTNGTLAQRDATIDQLREQNDRLVAHIKELTAVKTGL